MSEYFEREMAVFNRHLESWRRERLHQFVLIHEDDVIGFFPTWGEATTEAYRQYGLGKFMINEIEAENEGVFITRTVPFVNLHQ